MLNLIALILHLHSRNSEFYGGHNAPRLHAGILQGLELVIQATGAGPSGSCDTYLVTPDDEVKIVLGQELLGDIRACKDCRMHLSGGQQAVQTH